MSADDDLSESDKVKRVAAAYAQWHEQPPPTRDDEKQVRDAHGDFSGGSEAHRIKGLIDEAYSRGLKASRGADDDALARARAEGYAAGAKQAGWDPEVPLPATEKGYWAWRKNYCVAAGAPFPAWHTAWHAAWSAWEAGVAAGRALATATKLEREGEEEVGQAGEPPTDFDLWWAACVKALEPGSWTAKLVAWMAWQESEARTLRRCDKAATVEDSGTEVTLGFIKILTEPAAAFAAAHADSVAAVGLVEAAWVDRAGWGKVGKAMQAARRAKASLTAAINTWQAEVMSARVAVPADARDPAEWQCVHENTTASSQLERLRVAGGWLYRSTQWVNGDDDEGPSSQSESMAFVAEAGQE